MWHIITRLLWNERRSNSWIFVELLFVSFFLFMVIDPLFVLIANREIPSGYQPERCYKMRLMYNFTKANEDAYRDTTKDVPRFISTTLRQLPEVECLAVVSNPSLPNGASWMNQTFYRDSVEYNKNKKIQFTKERNEKNFAAQVYRVEASENSDFFRSYGVNNYHTGELMKQPENGRGKIFFSAFAARQFLGTTDVVGKTVYDMGGDKYTIAGVVDDIKHFGCEQPYPLAITTDHRAGPACYYVLRIKEEVDMDEFDRKIKMEVMPNLRVGYYYLDEAGSFTDQINDAAESRGRNNKMRMQVALILFAMLCIFLGLVGTFWIRCESRRQEIGLMRSLGASSAVIVRQHLLEAFLLISVAALITLPFLLYKADVSGFYITSSGLLRMKDFPINPAYLQNRFWPHFCIVFGLSYLAIMAVGLIATYIPTRSAIKTLPAEALRDE